MPSRRRATAKSSFTRGSVCLHLLQDRILLERLVERHVQGRRDQLGDLVDLGECACRATRPTSLMTAFASIVPNVMIWATCSRPYLRVTYSMTSPRPSLAEVDVDIGQRHPLRVQEALEEEVVVERIDVGDAQAVGHQAAGGRAATRPDGNALLARVADEVPDDQEVAGELHLLDHLELVGADGVRTRRSCGAAAPAPSTAAGAAGAP